jgi:hypothetical protein
VNSSPLFPACSFAGLFNFTSLFCFEQDEITIQISNTTVVMYTFISSLFDYHTFTIHSHSCFALTTAYHNVLASRTLVMAVHPNELHFASAVRAN